MLQEHKSPGGREAGAHYAGAREICANDERSWKTRRRSLWLREVGSCVAGACDGGACEIGVQEDLKDIF